MDYYVILNLTRDCTQEDIKKSYREIARKIHPDKVEENEKDEATKKFQQLGEAYETLSDPEKRKNYDIESIKKEINITAEVCGKIVYINPKNKTIFHIFTEQSKKKYRCIYEKFLPISKGDAIFGLAEYSIYRNEECLTFKSPPFVMIGTDKETILETIKTGLKIFNTGKIESVYNILSKKDFDLISTHYNYESLDFNPYISFSLVLDEKSLIKLANYWYKNRVLRKLYLLGINNKEIHSSKINPLKLYDNCLENPYNVLSLPLEKCDEIVSRIGKSIDDKYRESGKIIRKIGGFMDNGWTGIPTKTLVRLFPKIMENISLLKSEFGLHCEYNTIYLDYAYEVESSVANWMKELLVEPPNYLISEISYTRNDLSEGQKEAINKSLSNNVSIITGAGGSGKTTVIKELVYNLEKNGINYRLASFTGKAVSRIREVTGKKEAATLHMMISLAKGKKANFSCLILDESSMITAELLYEFRKRFSQKFSIIFVGDVNQLPPIGWGGIFEALINSKKFPTTYLKTNHRSNNGITVNARKIIEYDENFEFEITTNFKVIQGNAETIQNLIQILNNNGIASNHIVVISPYNKDLNIINENCSNLYNSLNRSVKDARNKLWRIGDRVMHTDNNYTENLTNGDEGIIVDVDYQSVSVKFKENTFKYSISKIEEDYEEKELNTKSLILSFAVSVHRYQGSEIDYVIGYVPESENTSFLNSNLLYTLITRAKKIIWLVGDVKTMIKAATTKRPWRCCNLLKRLEN